MIDIPALQERGRYFLTKLEELVNLNRRLGGTLSPRLRSLEETLTSSLLVTEKLLFWLELEMHMAIAQDSAFKHALKESSGKDPPEAAELVTLVNGQLGFPPIDLDAVELDPEVATIVPRELAVKYRLIAFGWIDQDGKTYLQVAMADPTNIFAADEVRFTLGHQLKIYVASEEQIERAIEKYGLGPAPERA